MQNGTHVVSTAMLKNANKIITKPRLNFIGDLTSQPTKLEYIRTVASCILF